MDKIRLGIVGLGNMGSGHFYNVFGGKCPSVEVTAVCDINPEKLENSLSVSNAAYLSTWTNDWAEIPTDEALFEKYLNEKCANEKSLKK